MRKNWWRLVLALGMMLTLAACGQTQRKAAPDKIRVVTSLKVYQEAAQAVLGKYGSATAIISSPDVDPHDFEASTGTAKQVADADLVISNGLGYDDWLSKLTTAANSQDKLISVATTVLHKQDGANEHVFYDAQLMPKLTAYLAKRYAKLQPQHAAYFKKRAQQYVASLAPLRREIKKVQTAGQGKYAAAAEPVFDYALQASGYKLRATHFAKAIEDGTDPSPKDLEELQGLIRQHKIAVFVVNVQEESALVNQVAKLARKNGVKVISVRETQPQGQNYLEWMLSNYKQME